jgi:hypothetical protein
MTRGRTQLGVTVVPDSGIPCETPTIRCLPRSVFGRLFQVMPFPRWRIRAAKGGLQEDGLAQCLCRAEDPYLVPLWPRYVESPSGARVRHPRVANGFRRFHSISQGLTRRSIPCSANVSASSALLSTGYPNLGQNSFRASQEGAARSAPADGSLSCFRASRWAVDRRHPGFWQTPVIFIDVLHFGSNWHFNAFYRARVQQNENGPNGGYEINILKPGRNYGWPIVSYGRIYPGPGNREARATMDWSRRLCFGCHRLRYPVWCSTSVADK